MIRKGVIVVLTLGAVTAGAAWPGSYYYGVGLIHTTDVTFGSPHPLPARSVSLLGGAIFQGWLYVWSERVPDGAMEGERALRFRSLLNPGWEWHVVERSIDPLLFAIVRLNPWRPVIIPTSTVMLISTPLWLAASLFAAYPAIAFIRGPLRRWRRRRRGECQNCGYNLTGNVTGVCSECGTKIESP